MNTFVRLALAAIMFAGCAASAPTPSPGGFSEVVAALVVRGITVHEHVSGDDGCPRVELHDNAAHLTVSTADDATRRDVYLFRWRRATDYAAAARDFFLCVADFRSEHPEIVVEVVEQSPWRALGADWSDSLMTAVTEALASSSGG